MERREREGPQVANNRLALVVVVGSMLALVAFVVLSLLGSFSGFLPERLPEIEMLPLYLIGGLLLIALVVWSWERVISFF